MKKMFLLIGCFILFFSLLMGTVSADIQTMATYTLNNSNELTAVMYMNCTGVDAKDLRTDIDANSDGTISDSEIMTYENDMENAKPSSNKKPITIDDKEKTNTITNQIQLIGAKGNTDSDSLISVHGIGTSKYDIDSSKSTHIFKNMNINEGFDIIFNVPENWKITKTTGLDNEIYNSDKTTVHGTSIMGGLTIEMSSPVAKKEKSPGFLGVDFFMMILLLILVISVCYRNKKILTK